MIGFLAFIILLPIVVFVHEFGHFIFARLNGVKVESFSIGFGRSAFSWVDKYGTQWKICVIPLGGYVKMLGQSDTPETVEEKNKKILELTEKEKSQSFEFKKRYQKAMIVAAGPVFNFIFGFVVFFCLYWWAGVPSGESVVLDVRDNSPAYVAGMRVGDAILSVNGTKVSDGKTVPNLVQKLKDGKLFIDVERDGKVLSVVAVPENVDGKYFLGIAYGEKFEKYEGVGFVASLSKAYTSVANIISGTSKSLVEILIGKRKSSELGGIISIAKVGGNALSQGIYSFISLIAFISVSLGLFNIFPIPVLDGGYLFMYLIEAVIRRNLSDKVKEVLFFMGFMFIVFLLLLSNINDVIRILR